MMKQKELIYSFAIASVAILLITIGYKLTLGPINSQEADLKTISNTLFRILGGNFLGGGYIQFITYIAFLLALFSYISKKKEIESERTNRDVRFENKDLFDYLSQPQLISGYQEVSEIKQAIIDSGNAKDYNKKLSILLKLCLRYIPTKSISDTATYLTEQIKIDKDEADNSLAYMRFLLWAIPSIGFVGTVIGISTSIGYVNSGNNDMTLMINQLSVAFDTTLVSLILSIIGMAIYTSLEKDFTSLYNEINEFLYVHFINKLQN